MKHVKKTLAILLAAAMMFTLIACAANETPVDTPPQPTPATTPNESGPNVDAPITDEPITLKVWQWALDNQTTDFETLWYYQQMAAHTNIHLEWTVVKESEWNESLNMMWLSNELPDVIIRPSNALNIEDLGVEQGFLMQLDGLIEANMPNYSSRLGMNDVSDVLKASDGNMYYIGYLVAQRINHDATFFINQTWLDAVNKEIPTTIDELTDVLKAFRDEKPGADGMWPMSASEGIEHQTNGIYNYFAMFGVPLQRWVYATVGSDGTVVFPGFMDGFREACEWLAMCYAEGLLDPDALTQENAPWVLKANSDQLGFQTYLRLIATAWDNPDTIQNWVHILPPAAERTPMVPRILEVPEFGAVLTVANKHPAETLQWLDLQFETEWMLIATNGPTVMTDEVREILGDDATDEAPLYFEDGKWRVRYVPDNQALYKIVPIQQGQFFAPGDYYFDIFELPPHRQERMEQAARYQQAGVLEPNSFQILTRLVKPTPDEASELERLFVDIESLMKTSIANFIINGVTDASWDQFVDEANNVGVARYLEIYQKLYSDWRSAMTR